MATIAPPPSKRQRREALEKTQVQQDVSQPTIEAGSFKARFVDNEGNQMADVIEVPLGDATEKNVSLLLNTLLGRVRHISLSPLPTLPDFVRRLHSSCKPWKSCKD
jgi:ribosome assembly protein 4